MRQEKEPRAALADYVGSIGALVDRQVVQDDDVASLKCGCKLGFDVDVKSCPVDCAWDDPGSGQLIASQSGDERRCLAELYISTVLRLSQLLPGDAVVQVSDPQREDMRQFLSAIEEEGKLDPKDLKVSMTLEEAITFLRKAYGVE